MHDGILAASADPVAAKDSAEPEVAQTWQTASMEAAKSALRLARGGAAPPVEQQPAVSVNAALLWAMLNTVNASRAGLLQ